MNAKVLSIVGVTILALGGMGAYIWWPKDHQAPIVTNDDKDKDKKDKKDPKDPNPNNGKPQVKPVSYQPAPVSMAAATEFLHTGPNPVQVGMDPKILDARRAAALRGMVFKDEKDPFPSVNVSIQNQPVYGTGSSRPDGTYDMVVNGGGLMTVGYKHEGYLPVWRQTSVPWQDYVWLPPVVMSKVDSKYTAVKSDSKALQTVRASKVKDQDGERQATLLFPGGNTATMILPDGTKKKLDTLNIRATEYTVGKKGPDRMPAPLPANSGYTYCVELSADEALQANAKTVQFEKPVAYYVENFLNFPVGIAVPAGYFDPEKGAWVASKSGRVIKILDVKNALAVIDVAGKGVAADEKALKALDVSNDELRELAQLYKVGTTLWRVAIPHFSIWDLNWGFSPPPDAVPPKMPPPVHNPAPGKKPPHPPVKLPGIDWKLNPHHDHGKDGKDGAPGRTIHIPVCGKTLPKTVKLIVIEIFIAGQRIEVELPANPDQIYIFVWDGLDVFGRPCQCSPNVRIRIGYVYDGVYEQTAVFGRSGNAEIITGSRTRREVTLWQEHQFLLEYFDSRAFGLGGWSFDIQHAYDPISRTLNLGTGERHKADIAQLGNLVISTIAGGGKKDTLGDSGPAIEARLDDPSAGPGFGTPRRRGPHVPRGIATAPDGTLFIGDANDRIRKVDRNGAITTVAGAKAGELQRPSALALAPDGSLYIAEAVYVRTARIRRLAPDGKLTTVAGGDQPGFSGDGGPAVKATLRDPTGLAVAPDGTLYIADQDNHCIRRITPDGVITTIAGQGGTLGYSGDGGPALKAKLYWPTSVAFGPDGSLFFSDQGNYVIRRISNSGIITTVAGTYFADWTHQFGGDGGPALKAKFDDPTCLAVTADGSLYIADSANHRIRHVGPDGIIRTLAGVKTKDHGDFSGDGGPAQNAKLSYPTALAFGPDGSLYFYDATYQRGHNKPEEQYFRQRVRRISPPIAGFSNTEVAVPSPDGKELFKFNAQGQHLETLDAASKQVRVRLDYDKAGKLMKIEDVQSKTAVTFERDEKGHLRTILTPKDVRTVAHLDAKGYLEKLVGPAGEMMRASQTEPSEKANGPTQKGAKVEQPAGKGQWQVQKSGVTDDLRAVTFLSDEVGVGGGDNKTVLKTIDGGKTWKRMIEVEKGVTLRELVFSTPKLGWTMDGAGLILRTTDGGDSWSKMPPPDTGLGACVPTLAAAGSTCFYMTHGFVTPSIYQTTDAGKNWTALNEKLPLSGNGPCARLVFTDAKHAFFVTTSDGGKLGRTEDGGKTWQYQKTAIESRMDHPRIAFVDKDHGWYCLFDGDVFATTDGGKTWTARNFKRALRGLVDLHFADVKVGHMLVKGEATVPDAQGEVMRTTDAGKTWTGLGELVAPRYLNAISFPSANQGWVVGDLGYIACYQSK